ncbi:hypothetical protein HMN09_00238500 [Mycena chlorophos]|uniref:Uncharacterized protein n=1 Tax=Mycena chlorophos TaxID=658473 RepID=A0A8H6WLE9_MYCCL|nr:hypothetical protein HMN09_00238500 [Mycena chlorophos]
MATRSFSVFCDSPVDVTVDVAKPAVARVVPAVLAATSPNVRASTSVASASAAEKENIHPVTGEHCAQPPSPSKKRKVLATKAVVAKKDKKEKEGKAGKRKATTKKTRRVSPLPRLDEEDSAVRKLVQADIDARCVDLTVSPLADVTQAYDEGFDLNSALDAFTSEEGAKFRKAASQEPEIRDYFSAQHHSSRATTPTPTTETKVFSTPEREQIYTAFTFTSPSPTSDRFRDTRRSRSPTPTPA